MRANAPVELERSGGSAWSANVTRTEVPQCPRTRLNSTFVSTTTLIERREQGSDVGLLSPAAVV